MNRLVSEVSAGALYSARSCMATFVTFRSRSERSPSTPSNEPGLSSSIGHLGRAAVHLKLSDNDTSRLALADD